MNTETTVAGEAVVFVLFVISGIICGIIYDLSDIIRSKLRKPAGLYDIISGIILSMFIIFTFLKISNLTIGISSFLGIITGCTLYFTVFSGIFKPILKFFCNFFEKILKILLYPVKLSCIILKKCSHVFKKAIRSVYEKVADSAGKLLIKFRKI